MTRTLYASFADPSLAEKAAGALLDHGVRAEDISLIHHESYRDTLGERPYAMRSVSGRAVADTGYAESGTGVAHGAYRNPDDDNDMVDAADAGVAGTKSVGNRAAEYGDRAAGTVADAVGADDTAAGYRAAAERRDDIADAHASRAGAEWSEATDQTPSARRDANNDAALRAANYNTGLANDNTRLNDATPGMDYDDTRSGVVDDDADDDLKAKTGISTTTASDAGAGAVKGTAIGAGVGVAAALAALFIPGVGLVVGGGALAAALGGVAASAGAGAIAGGVFGYLKDQGMEDEVATRYSDTIEAGGAILAVTVPSGDCTEAEAQQVLNKYGATNFGSYDAIAA